MSIARRSVAHSSIAEDHHPTFTPSIPASSSRSHPGSLRNLPTATPLPKPIAAAAFFSLMLFAWVARWAPWDPKSELVDNSFLDEDPINVAERVAAVHTAKFKSVVSESRKLKQQTEVKVKTETSNAEENLEMEWQIQNPTKFNVIETQKGGNIQKAADAKNPPPDSKSELKKEPPPSPSKDAASSNQTKSNPSPNEIAKPNAQPVKPASKVVNASPVKDGSQVKSNAIETTTGNEKSNNNEENVDDEEFGGDENDDDDEKGGNVDTRKSSNNSELDTITGDETSTDVKRNSNDKIRNPGDTKENASKLKDSSQITDSISKISYTSSTQASSQNSNVISNSSPSSSQTSSNQQAGTSTPLKEANSNPPPSPPPSPSPSSPSNPPPTAQSNSPSKSPSLTSTSSSKPPSTPSSNSTSSPPSKPTSSPPSNPQALKQPSPSSNVSNAPLLNNSLSSQKLSNEKLNGNPLTNSTIQTKNTIQNPNSKASNIVDSNTSNKNVVVSENKTNSKSSSNPSPLPPAGCADIFSPSGKLAKSSSSQPLFPTESNYQKMLDRALEALRNAEKSSGLKPGNLSSWTSSAKSLKKSNLKEGLTSCVMKPSSIAKPEDLAKRKFLAIVTLPEKLSRARVHLAEAIAWAKKLNRVLILPRVGQGQISMFQSAPFCSYFDFSILSPFVDWITEDAFVELMKCSHKSPSVSFWCMRNPSVQPKLDLSMCYFNLNPLQLASLMELTGAIYPTLDNSLLMDGFDKGFSASESIPMDSFQNIFNKLNTKQNADVILFNKGLSLGLSLPNNLVDDALERLKFAPHLVEKADSIVRQHLQPRFISAHMRLEIGILKNEGNVSGDQPMACANGLLKLAKQKMAELATDKAFLAVDLQISPKGVKRSPEWDASPQLSPKKELVRKAQQHVISSLKALTLDDVIPEASELDSGISSIMDRLISAKADVFLVGPKVCGGGSTFERSIRKLRRVYGKQNVHLKWMV